MKTKKMVPNYQSYYLQEASGCQCPPDGLEGRIAWESPSNIALIKYWGKKDHQIPLNPSVSITLSVSKTRTEIIYSGRKTTDRMEIKYFFHNQRSALFEDRLSKYLEGVKLYLPFLQDISFEIYSENTFPHSSGIASSASAYSSIALCLLDIESQITGQIKIGEEFYRKASFLARLGSGSASRSVYGGLVLWGKTKGIKDSSDELAIPINDLAHDCYKSFYDVILVIDALPKAVSSTKGHGLMIDNPYSKVRFSQAKQNLSRIMETLRSCELLEFFNLIEYEALSLHAMMMTSFPGYFLMKPATLSIIEKIRQFRSESSVPVGFTLDAGANVHVLFPAEYKSPVLRFLETELKDSVLNQHYIMDQCGQGPRRITDV
jgi:diphosphomevalonate decarboxylase